MDRAAHLAWAKQRALEYVEMGDFNGALASMVCDCNNHDELIGHSGNQLGMMLRIGGHLKTKEQVRDHIEGYN